MMSKAKEIGDAADRVGSQIEKHGFATVLAMLLIAFMLTAAVFFARYWTNEQQKHDDARDEQIANLNLAMEADRDFIRLQLTEIIKLQIDATQKHTTAIESLTDEIKSNQ